MHEVRVRRLTVAVDVGRVVNPDGVRNQLEGGAVQATSWTLRERVRFDRRRVTSTDWESYPILRFGEVPPVDVEVISRPDEPSLGAGEAAQGPTAAAIGNAVADAIGVRVRDLPITADSVIAAMSPPPPRALRCVIKGLVPRSGPDRGTNPLITRKQGERRYHWTAMYLGSR